MRQAFYLAVRSLLWHRGRAVTIVLSLAVVLWLPVTVRLLLDEFRREITARADSTPLVVGARGSRLDLALHALYFETMPPDTVTMAEASRLMDQELGLAIPLHVRYRTQTRPGVDGAVIVGTSPEYLEFRQLVVANGESFALLGDCVVGAAVAERMKLQPGGSLLSAPKNALNLAGDYPLKMRVTGILRRANSPDDNAVFTDVRTAWVIDGIGHGHQELTATTDPALLIDPPETSRSDASGDVGPTIAANAGVLPYTEITPANIGSFHFHGDPETFPLTAIIVVPHDDKSRARILGSYVTGHAAAQCLKPPEVIAELLGIVVRIEQFAWICSFAALIVTGMLLSLVLSLSMKLRAAEMQTMFRLGCSRTTIAMLHVAEIALMLLAAGGVAAGTAFLTVRMAGTALRALLF